MAMKFGKAILSVVPDILGDSPGVTGITCAPNGIAMPGQNPCKPGCTCGHHKRSRKIEWSDREARNAYLREYRAARRDELRAKAREKYQVNRESVRATQRARYAADPGRYREEKRAYRSTLKPGVLRARDQRWRYGLPSGEFERMLAEQDGRCYLCGEPLNLDDRRAFAVDHDHACCRGYRSCGKCIRGVSCGQCNKGIGHFGDDPERMRRVAERLEAANTAVAERIATRPVQTELPINIKRAARRQEESA